MRNEIERLCRPILTWVEIMSLAAAPLQIFHATPFLSVLQQLYIMPGNVRGAFLKIYGLNHLT